MQLQVKGKNLPVTDALRAHAERKAAKLDRILPPWDAPTHVEIELFVEHNRSVDRRQVAEATVRTKGPVLRAREHADDMYLAIDHVVQKLERQAARYRDRRKSHRDPHGRPPEALENGAATADEPSDDGIRIVKRKRFEMKPMLPEDAAFHLDLLNHDFYVFRHAETDAVNVIYRRADGDLGLIAPQ